MSESVTLLSVVYDEYSTIQLNCNRLLFEKTNKGEPCRWVVGVNNEVEIDMLPFKKGYYEQIVPCVSMVGRTRRQKDIGKFNPSTAHGMAINKLLRNVETRYVLVIDPDFFVVYMDWVKKLIAFMIENKLTIFGSTWFPGHFKKYRYFPTVHFMLIDLDGLDRSELDFQPDHNTDRYLVNDSDSTDQNRTESKCRLLRGLSTLVARHNTIGISRDTGYRVFRRYQKDPHVNYKTLLCSYIPYDRNKYFSRQRFLVIEALERIMRDDRRFLPRRGTYSLKTFSDYGKPDLYSRGWEEFFWGQNIFAFHVRNTQRCRDIEKGRMKTKVSEEELIEVIKEFVE